MATAKNITLLVGGHNIADAVTGFTFSGETETLDATVVASSGGYRTKQAGIRSGKLYVTGIFDADTVNADAIDDILTAAYSSGTAQDVLASTGTVAVGEPALMINGSQMDYATPIEVAGLILSNANFDANSGVKFGRWLANDQLSAGTNNGTSLDNSASSANGGFFMVHLHNDDSTDVDVKLQHSTDNSVWADVTGGAINNLSATYASGSVSVTGTINRYIRIVATVTGGDTFLVSAAFARG